MNFASAASDFEIFSQSVRLGVCESAEKPKQRPFVFFFISII